jgi:hypothetical protein
MNVIYQIGENCRLWGLILIMSGNFWHDWQSGFDLSDLSSQAPKIDAKLFLSLTWRIGQSKESLINLNGELCREFLLSRIVANLGLICNYMGRWLT